MSTASNVPIDSISTGMDIQSVGSCSTSQTNVGSEKKIRQWGWAITNKWAERVDTPNGIFIKCLFPGCKSKYETKSMTTSGINNHLFKIHRIHKESNPNDGSLSNQGPLDILFNSDSRPRIFDPTRFDDLLVRFVVTTKQPFTIVKSPALQELLNHATMASISQVKLPSDDSMAAKVKPIFSFYFSSFFTTSSIICNSTVYQTKRKYGDIEQEVIALFEDIAKVSFTVDGWTSPFQDDFLGVTAHWIDKEWHQKELVIGFEPLNGAHTGENLAEALVNVIERFNLSEKLQSITTDNASNMTKMVHELINHPKAIEW